MPRGGLRDTRTNSKPMPVSGPGSLSQRTDMAPKPSNALPSIPAPKPTSAPTQPIRSVTPLFADSAYPDVPVTNGHYVGPGETPDKPIPDRYAMLKKYSSQLDAMAMQPDAPEAFVNFWRYAKAAAKG